jgi:hypothetical protein
MQQHKNKKEKSNPDFLTSCFYYYQHLIFRNSESKSTPLDSSKLSLSFRKIKTTPLLIIDYPNVIHTLYETYQNQEEVAKHFYHYLSKIQNKKQTVIIAKQVTIENESYNIDLLINLGRSLSNNHFLSLKNIFIYQLDYTHHISSSMDDLIGYFICFVSLIYYLREKGINLSQIKVQNHIQYLTNDKQSFDKNLFGKTREEIQLHPQVILEKMEKPHQQYFLVKDKRNQTTIQSFLKQYMIAKSDDTQQLECNIKDLLFSLSLSNKQTKSKERKKQFTYKKISELQKRQTRKKSCDYEKVREKGKLLPSYYLYTMIKYTQIYLKNDFYGSFSKEDIIKQVR